MPNTQITPFITAIPLGIVNAFLIAQDELTLIDTGVPGSAPKILDAIRASGRQPFDLKHILLTHLHMDHVGSAAALQKATGAHIYMHPSDAAAFQQGQIMRPVQPGPGLVNRMVHRFMPHPGASSAEEKASVDQFISDGDTLLFAGGLQVIHTPGHSAGHLAFLWPQDGGVLFVADACSNLLRLSYSFIYEDLAEGRRSLKKLSTLEFETAVFGHGRPMRSAAEKFRQKWG